MTPGTDPQLSRISIRSGRYEGLIRSTSEPKLLIATQTETVDSDRIELTLASEGEWRISFSLPETLLSDGVQTLLINDAETGARLDSVTCTMGTPTDFDLVAEMTLLRAELDTLKRAFQRHCSETS